MHIHSLRRAALTACAIAVLGASSASAASVTTQLRVEAGGHDIGPGWVYAHDSVTYDTSQSAACNGSGEPGSITGPTALGVLVQAADYTNRLDPVRISDQFEFGPFVCGVGSYPSTDSAFWLYKVDHVAPEVGGDQFPINSAGHEVLWYLSDMATGANTGNELSLSVGQKVVKVGSPVDVTVLEYDFSGASTPAAGVRILGTGSDAVTDAAGNATVVFDRTGRQSIRGARGIDIPTDGVRLCAWLESETECETFIAGRVVGTRDADRIRGTDEPDRIIGRDGDDRIRSRGDDAADAVRCGPGDDVAKVDRIDRVARNCETVRRP
jgi:hypothetical protein